MTTSRQKKAAKAQPTHTCPHCGSHDVELVRDPTVAEVKCVGFMALEQVARRNGHGADFQKPVDLDVEKIARQADLPIGLVRRCLDELEEAGFVRLGATAAEALGGGP